MKAKGANGVGRFSVEFDIANHVDIGDAQRGLLPPEKVRRLTIRGVVDSGATKIVLPGKTVKQLGLPHLGKVKVRYANNATATRDTVTVHVQLLGREGIFTAIVEPKRRSALIGAIVLEDLDLIVNCTRQRLIPRDPRFIVSEVECQRLPHRALTASRPAAARRRGWSSGFNLHFSHRGLGAASRRHRGKAGRVDVLQNAMTRSSG